VARAQEVTSLQAELRGGGPTLDAVAADVAAAFAAHFGYSDVTQTRE